MFGMMRRKFSRFIINPKFQWDFIVRVSILALINFVSILAVVQYLFYRFKQHGISIGLHPNSAFFAFLDQQHTIVNYTFVGLGLFMVLALFFGGVMLSHRVAGPLYRLHCHMKDIADGKTSRHVKFRQKDYFQELSSAFNKQLDYHKDDNQAS